MKLERSCAFINIWDAVNLFNIWINCIVVKDHVKFDHLSSKPKPYEWYYNGKGRPKLFTSIQAKNLGCLYEQDSKLAMMCELCRATLDKQSCVITSTLFEMNSTCMRSCDLNFSCLSTSITSPEVSGCQNNKRIQIQYGRSCLHFVSSNFNFVNLRQLLAFPCANQLKSVHFVCII